MKVTLAMVMSLDGKITKWHEPHIYTWTSQEDQKHFFSLIEKYPVIIMGRKTYDVAKPIIKHTPGKLRIILTTDAQKYEADAIPDQLSFTSSSPQEIISELEKKEYSDVLLAGGEQTNTAFLKVNLVTDLLITIEPHLFGNGNTLLTESKLDIPLQLKKITRLNEPGTLLLHYRITTPSHSR